MEIDNYGGAVYGTHWNYVTTPTERQWAYLCIVSNKKEITKMCVNLKKLYNKHGNFTELLKIQEITKPRS